jgi:hypothetical protein
MSSPGQVLVTTQGDLEPYGPLPVRIRTEEGVLVANGVTGESIAVASGKYEVSVLKPDAIEYASAKLVNVRTGGAAAVKLGDLELAVPEPSILFVAANGLAPEMQQDDADQELAAPQTVDAQLWCGRWMERWPDIQTAFKAGIQPGVIRLSETEPTIIGSNHVNDRFLVTPYEAEGKTILRFSIVPHDECVACVGSEGEDARIAATLRPGKLIPTIKYRSLRSEEANSLLDFVDAGRLSDMQSVTAPMIERGVAGMLDAQFSLLRGTMGAYVMLRANSVDKLEPWLEEMIVKAPGLSDIRIMRAELLGRLGRHAEAVNEIKTALVELCPWFRSGMSYLLERLRLYLEIEEEDKATLPMTKVDWEVFAFAKSRLEKLGPYLVPGNLFTTFDIPK